MIRLSSPFLVLGFLLGSVVPYAALARNLSQSVFATVGLSEWCPPGYVHIDLEDGRFEWISQFPRAKCDGASSRPIRHGQISPNQLDALRQATARAEEAGFTLPECLAGKDPPNIVISNAGPSVLMLRRPKSSISAPSDLGCWSRPAYDLHRLIGHMFDLRVRAIDK